MGMLSNPRKGGGRRRSRHRPMGDINVTPMVDVMLVLLIVFMVTAPLLAVGIPVKLPEIINAQQLKSDPNILTVTITKTGKISLQNSENSDQIEPGTLLPRLSAIFDANQDLSIFVRGDETATYGEVARLYDIITEAKFPRVILVMQLPEGKT